MILDKNQGALRWDDKPSDAALADLDEGRVKKFVEQAGLRWDSMPNALEKLGVMRQGKLLNSAPLFFGKVPGLQLRCAVFATASSSTILDRHDYEGDILELIGEAQKYILKNIRIGMRLEGLYRVDVPEISAPALREAVINAFCHRDYRDPEEVRVAIFKDRVEIRSPGELFGGLTIHDLRKGNVSKRRNPLIADLLRRIHMVEGWGRGMPLILEEEPNVRFRETAKIFIAEFARPLLAENEDGAGETVTKTGTIPGGGPEAVTITGTKTDTIPGDDPETSTITDTIPGGGPETVTITSTITGTIPDGGPETSTITDDDGLSETEKAIVALLRKRPTMTLQELAAHLKLKHGGIRYHIDKLKAKGLLRRVGTKNGYWVVGRE